MTAALRVGVIEDERRTREGLAALIAGTPGCRSAGAWASMEDALAHLDDARPDVVLCDIGLPGMTGIDGVRQMKERRPDLQVVMLTVYGDNDSVFEAICAGACGYLLKDTPPARLVYAIREAAAGGAPMSPEIARRVVTMFQAFAPPVAENSLTSREREVLQLLASGHSYKTAAGALGVSIDTLRSHIRHIYEKLHVNSKSEAVLKAFRSGFIRLT